MRTACLFLAGLALLGQSSKSQREDKIHLSLTYSERNGLACPSGGPISMLTGSLQGVSMLSAFSKMGNILNDAFSGNAPVATKTTGENIRRHLTTPLSQAAAELPICASAQGQLEAELRWDGDQNAYVVDSGTYVWTATNNSRIQAKDHLLYGKLSCGGTHKLTEGEVIVKFQGEQLSKALSPKSKGDEKTSYTLKLSVKPEGKPLVGETGWLVNEGKYFETKERYTAMGTEKNTVTVSTYRDQEESRAELFSQKLEYSAEDMEVDPQTRRASFAETWLDPAGTQVAIHWEFNKPPSEVEVSVVRPEEKEAYEKWLPEGNSKQPDQPGNSYTVHAWAHKPGDPKSPSKEKVNLVFEFSDVSMQKGMCINWPQGAVASEGLRMREAENQQQLDVTNVRCAKTKGLVQEADLILTCFDSGAWGTLKVTAKDKDGKPVKVNVLGKAGANLVLPSDENYNHIADVWEKEKKVENFSATWDEAEVLGQEVKGDGLSLYEKYRGAVVLDGGQERWTRLEPKEKVLFVFDESNIFDVGEWYSASGIRAYKLSANMAKAAPEPSKKASRIVNTCSGDMKNGDKYGLVVTLVSGVQQKGSNGGFLAGETMSSNAPRVPRHVLHCCVFQDNIEAHIGKLVNVVKFAAADANSSNAKLLKEKADMPFWLVQQLAEKLKDRTFEQSLVQQLIRLTAFHEVGHACNLPGHVVGGEETAQGNVLCNMRYATGPEDGQFVLLQTLFKPGTTMPSRSGVFCKDANFHCWKHLDVKDNGRLMP